MPTPAEHKTFQARILAYAEANGWTLVSREEADQRRGFDPALPPEDRVRNRFHFLGTLLDAKLPKFSHRTPVLRRVLLGQFRHLHTDINGNRECVEPLRTCGQFFDHEEKRERELISSSERSHHEF
jgi:type I restriction enzyme R subunit